MRGLLDETGKREIADFYHEIGVSNSTSGVRFAIHAITHLGLTLVFLVLHKETQGQAFHP